MDLTNNYRALILSGLRASGVSKTELAEKMGFGKAWVTKLLNGTLKSVSDVDARRIEEILNIRFIQVIENSKAVSGLAVEVDEAIGNSEQFAKVIRELLPLVQETPLTPRYFETKEMSKLGQEIIRLCYANEDKPGKVAREVLKLVSEESPKLKKKLPSERVQKMMDSIELRPKYRGTKDDDPEESEPGFSVIKKDPKEVGE